MSMRQIEALTGTALLGIGSMDERVEDKGSDKDGLCFAASVRKAAEKVTHGPHQRTHEGRSVPRVILLVLQECAFDGRPS